MTSQMAASRAIHLELRPLRAAFGGVRLLDAALRLAVAALRFGAALLRDGAAARGEALFGRWPEALRLPDGRVESWEREAPRTSPAFVERRTGVSPYLRLYSPRSESSLLKEGFERLP